MTNIAHITNWVSLEAADAKIKEMKDKGLYAKNQIKKSSYRFADNKDKSKGYLCRVLVEAGIHPELELADLPKGRKKNLNPTVAVPKSKTSA